MTILILFLMSCSVARLALLVPAAPTNTTLPSSLSVDQAYSTSAINDSGPVQIFGNVTLTNPTLNQWTPCNFRHRIPNTEFVLVILELGGVAFLGLLEHIYYNSLVVLQGRVDEGHGDTVARDFYIRARGVTAIALRYAMEPSSHPPTNRDLIKVFETLWYVTATKDYPKPNPPFSRETKFGLAFDDGPNHYWAARGVVQWLETDSELFASS